MQCCKKFSIIIINHNYGNFLNNSIESALAQKVDGVQTIVVDDGSVDNSADIIHHYRDRIIPVFKAAGGHVSALNAGFAAAEGKICIFLDADDILYPNCVETVLRRWRPGDVKVQYRLDTITASGDDQRMPFPHFPDDLTPEAVREQALRYGVYPWTVSSGNAYARRYLEDVLPIDDQEIYRSPDGYLNKMAPLFGDVRSITDILGAYRVHGANAWAQSGGELRVAPIVRWLKFDQVLQRHFEAEAAKRGLAVTPYAEIRTLQQMEYRLLAYRFAPGAFEQAGQTAAELFAMGLAAARGAPNTSMMGRGVWIVWMFMLAFFPKATVRLTFGMARGQTGRSAISKYLVRLSRGPSGPGPINL